VQFGLIVPENPQNPPGRPGYLADVDRLLAAVAGHYDSAWCIDHLQGDVLEGWTTVAYLAARHPGLRWGHTVLAQSFRNPALTAKMGATLQFLTGGRFVLGIGAGGQAAEYRAYGYDFPPGAHQGLGAGRGAAHHQGALDPRSGRPSRARTIASRVPSASRNPTHCP
jgi:alkanesulfonate monooxygenase SsuD/methylene tetrahydromethanopterin reductase-like flavin-dependent oxidoreductase (luciferase family)